VRWARLRRCAKETGCGRKFLPWFLPAALLALALIAFAGAQASGPEKPFEQKITTKVLPNGLTLIICERPDAPVFSYSTFIDAGDVNDPSGQSGLAHMFEHLAFKETSQIGTTDYAAEKIALGQDRNCQRRPTRPST